MPFGAELFAGKGSGDEEGNLPKMSNLQNHHTIIPG